MVNFDGIDVPISSIAQLDSSPATYSNRGGVHQKVLELVSKSATGHKAFKGIVESRSPEKTKDGVPFVYVLTSTNKSIPCKLSTPIGGLNRVLDFRPSKGDAVYCIKCLDDEMPIIFAYPNGYTGNRRYEGLSVNDEKWVARSQSWWWYKANGSFTHNIRNNHLLEIGNDFKTSVQANYNIEVLKEFNITIGKRLNLYATTALNIKCAKAVNIRSEESDINVRAAKNLWMKIDGKTELKCANILLGKSGGHEPAMLGTTAQTAFNTHTHIGNLGFPSAPPTSPMSALAAEVKVI